MNVEDKNNQELEFWRELYIKNTLDCKSNEDKTEKLLDISINQTFKRYMYDLYLNTDSFKGKTILDIGCGPHGGLIGFNDTIKYGVDHLINEYIEIGYPLSKHNITYYNEKSENLPFDDNSLDVVIAVNSLDHVDDVKKTIQEIMRVLKPNGEFLGQINMKKEPSLTEPNCLTNKELIAYFEYYEGDVLQITYQYSLSDEDRYFYKIVKNILKKTPSEHYKYEK